MWHASLTILTCLLAGSSLMAATYVVFFACMGVRVRRSRAASPLPSASIASTSFLVIIPAHNEGTGLLPALQSLERLSYPASLRQVIVIADNCADDTAAIARQGGALVWERVDALHRGKGQALAWAFQRAETIPHDAVVVIDADTVVDSHFLNALDRAFLRAAASGHTAVALQGRYEFARNMPSTQHDGPSSTLWFDTLTISSKAAENTFIYEPRSALGLVCLLQGNGFALSRSALERVPFHAASVVEDAEYALSLAFAGVPVLYVDEARVISRMTSRIKDATPQRLRWAGGIFTLLARSAPVLLREAIRRREWRLAEAAAMLLLTSRLVIIQLTLGALLLLPFTLHSGWFLVLGLLIGFSCLLQAVYLGLVFRSSSTTPVPLRTILFLPAYLGFVGFAQGCAALGIRRGIWQRTTR